MEWVFLPHKGARSTLRPATWDPLPLSSRAVDPLEGTFVAMELRRGPLGVELPLVCRLTLMAAHFHVPMEP